MYCMLVRPNNLLFHCQHEMLTVKQIAGSVLISVTSSTSAKAYFGAKHGLSQNMKRKTGCFGQVGWTSISNSTKDNQDGKSIKKSH